MWAYVPVCIALSAIRLLFLLVMYHARAGTDGAGLVHSPLRRMFYMLLCDFYSHLLVYGTKQVPESAALAAYQVTGSRTARSTWRGTCAAGAVIRRAGHALHLAPFARSLDTSPTTWRR